jgi:hypothetical protein
MLFGREGPSVDDTHRRQTKESTLQVDERRFDAPADRLEGTVKSASFRG